MRRGVNVTEDVFSAVGGAVVSPRERNHGCNGTKRRLRRVVEPVIHVRTRPVLKYLRESNDRRCVWCLDQQNIIVRGEKSTHESLSIGLTVSPTRKMGSVDGTPASPCVLFSSRCRSTPCTPKRTRYRWPPSLKSCDQVQNSPSRVANPPWPVPPMTLGTPVETLSDDQVAADKGTGQECGSPVPSLHNSSGVAFSTAQTSRRAVTPDVSMHRNARSAREDHFRFDFIHDEEATQEEVFEESVLDFVDMALFAKDVSIVCYGPTGSGKTYSVIGNAPRNRSHSSPMRPVAVASNKQRTPRPGRRPLLPLSARGTKSPAKAVASVFSSGHTTATGRHEAESASVQTGPASRPLSSKTLEMECASEGTAGSKLSSPSQTDVDYHAGGPSNRPSNPFAVNLTSSGEATTCGRADKPGYGGEFVYNETMGLLPRLVLVLLERRGSVLRVDQCEELTAKLSSMVKRPSNSSGVIREKMVDAKDAHSSSLTLRDLTFYGVELYLDEFRDLLHPTKRRIPVLGDIGGLDAFCQTLNEPTLCSGRRRGSEGGNHEVGGSDAASRNGGGVRINSVADFHRCYAMAARNRVTKTHHRNDVSSRSHAIFILQLHFELTEVLDDFSPCLSSPVAAGVDGCSQGNTGCGRSTSSAASAHSASVFSYVAIVDLAGSECVKQSGVGGTELREAQYINKSLSAFSAVLLAIYQRSLHVPYRDSKLTRLLRPCLEHGRVLVLAHVSPCTSKETLGALKFAEQLRHASVRLHNLNHTKDCLVAAFDDLKDSDAEEQFAQYRKSMEEYMLLCKEVRLAHFSKDSADMVTELHSATAPPKPSKSSVCAFSLEEVWHSRMWPHSGRKGNRVRECIVSKLTERHLWHHYQVNISYLQQVKEDIRREQSLYIDSVVERRKKEIENMRLNVEKMKSCNAQLAEENSQPVLRDAHAMEIKQRLKDLAAEVTKCAGEKLLLLEGIRAIRQRTLIQEELEQCLDEQLRPLPDGSVLSGTSLPSVVDSNFEDGMESIFNMQLLLSKEMSHLRKESTCFVRCDEIWEGLWARVMRQELMLAVALELEVMEGILLGSESIRWALESVGCDKDAVRDVMTSTSESSHAVGWGTNANGCLRGSVISVSKLLNTIDKSLEQSAVRWNSLPKPSLSCGDAGTASNTEACRAEGSESIAAFVAPIPLVMSSGEEVKSIRNLTGCYEDENKLQEACMEKMLGDGVHCELSFLPFGFDMRDLFVTRRSAHTPASQRKNTIPSGQWGALRLVHPAKDPSAYCLEFSQRTYAIGGRGRDRRLVSIPLDEPQLHMSLHVLELDSHVYHGSSLVDGSVSPTFPLIVLELKGVPPNATQPHLEAHQVQQQQVREEWSSYLWGSAPQGMTRQEVVVPNGTTLLSNSTDAASTQGAILTKRLDCGGDLVLPAVTMASCEKGNGIFLFQFSDPVISLPNRTESVECIVAALAGLTLPSSLVPAAAGATGACPGRRKSIHSDVKPIDVGCQGADRCCDVRVAAYNHIPHVLLGAYGGSLRNGQSPKDTTKPLTISMGVGMSPLIYASTMGIFFYFQRISDMSSSLNSSVSTVVVTVAGASPVTDLACHSSPLGNFRPSPRERVNGPFSGALSALVRLTSLSIPNSGSVSANVVAGGPSEGGENALNDIETLLLQIQRLQSMRRKVRTAVRQQIFDAEDIKAELLYSYSEKEFMRGSHIKDVTKEARELIDIQQQLRGNLGVPARVPVHASPALCRELSKFFVPWTLWQWAHRWQAFQEAYRNHHQQLGLFSLGHGAVSDTDSESNGQLSPEVMATSMGSLKVLDGFCGPTVYFEDIPSFLTGMV